MVSKHGGTMVKRKCVRAKLNYVGIPCHLLRMTVLKQTNVRNKALAVLLLFCGCEEPQ